MKPLSTKRKIIDRELVRNTEELRSIIGNRCESCGRYCTLTAHHIVKRSKSLDHSKENLLMLCIICHMRADHPNSSMKINGPNYQPFTIQQQKEKVTKRKKIKEEYI